MSECETVPVHYTVTAEFDDQSTPGEFGPIATREVAETVLVSLAGRTDVKKATLNKIAEV